MKVINETIQDLYDKCSSHFGKNEEFTIHGQELTAVIPYLKELPIFKEVEFEILDYPTFLTTWTEDDTTEKLSTAQTIAELDISNDGVKRYTRFNETITIDLKSRLKFSKNIKIHAIRFTSGFFNHEGFDEPGAYILPPKVSAETFTLNRKLLINIEMEPSIDPLIIPNDQLLNERDEESIRRKKQFIKDELIAQVNDKINAIFSMDANEWVDPNFHDVQRLGKVFIRVSKDSVDTNISDLFPDDSYFIVNKNVKA